MKNKETISLYERFDAAVQRLVDSAAIFMMRSFGLSKTIIRYALNALMITVFAVEFCCKFLHNGKPDIFLLVIIFVLLLGQHIEYLLDRKAEGSGAASSTDDRITTFLPNAKVMIWLVITAKPVVYHLAWHRLDKYERTAFVADLTGFIIFQTLLYLIRTPNAPPPAKERKKVLVPAQNEN